MLNLMLTWLELYLEYEDVEKPSKAEAPIVTIVKVDVH
jgi:hypothetical protein